MNKIIFVCLILLCTIGLTNVIQSKSYNIVTISGTVTDYKTKKPTSVTVSFYDLYNKRIGWSKSNSKTGSYLVTGLKPGEAYIIRIESIDYMRDEYEVILPNTTGHIELNKNFEVVPR
jgi:hypothetical protein